MANEIATINMPSNAVLAPMVQVSGIKGAYVQHPHKNARNYPAVQSVMPKGKIAAEDTPVLVDANSITVLDPFTFYFTPLYNQYFAEMDSNGDQIKTYGVADGSARPPSGAREIVDAVIVVAHNGVLTPARVRVKTGKCGLLKSAYEELFAMDRADKQFAPLVKAGLEPYYFLRFTASYGKGVGKTTKKEYYTITSTGEPTKAADAKTLMTAFKDPEFIDAINLCIEGHTDSVNAVNALMA